MKRWTIGLVGIALAVLACDAAASEQPPPAKPLVPGAAAAAPPPRHGMFAAGSAALARRLAPEEREEWRFLKDAAAAGQFELEASRLALARSGDAHLRSLAATLVNHHAASLASLQRMLQSRSMAAPMLSGEQRKALNRLAKLQGAKFDREWMESVALRSQPDNVQAFEKAAAGARDPHLRAWAARELPTLRYQLQVAERVMAGTTKYAKLSPSLPRSAIKSASPAPSAAEQATRSMGAPGAAGDLGEGNMLLGPAPRVALKVTEPGSR